MKRNVAASALAATLLAVLTIPLRSSAQDLSATNQIHRHARYKFIDLGTLGGPDSIVTFFERGVINSAGTVVGGADTSIPDPYFPNCLSPNCVVQHASEWKHGVLHDLGALPGTNGSFPWWVNERGWAAGGSSNGTIDPLTNMPAGDAVLWKDGEIINLGTLGGNESTAFGLNNAGQVTGFALNTTPVAFGLVHPFGTQERAFLWQNGHMKDLGTLGGPSSVGLYINDRGHVSGASYTNDIPEAATGMPPTEPFLWDGKKMRSLGSLGGVWGQAWGMNDRDQVIGNSSTADAPGACVNVDLGCHAVLWERGVLKDLGTLGGTWAFPTMLNDRGDVAGGANTLNDQTVRAVRWRDGVIKDLGGVDGDPCSLAYGLNNKGQIVGTSAPNCDTSLARAFLWENGEMIDLNARIPADSNFQLVYGEAINERGEITGIGVPAGISPADVEIRGHAFLLIPREGNDADWEDSVQLTTAAANPAAAAVNATDATFRKAAAETFNAFRTRILARQHLRLGSQSPK